MAFSSNTHLYLLFVLQVSVCVCVYVKGKAERQIQRSPILWFTPQNCSCPCWARLKIGTKNDVSPLWVALPRYLGHISRELEPALRWNVGSSLTYYTILPTPILSSFKIFASVLSNRWYLGVFNLCFPSLSKVEYRKLSDCISLSLFMSPSTEFFIGRRVIF